MKKLTQFEYKPIRISRDNIPDELYENPMENSNLISRGVVALSLGLITAVGITLLIIVIFF